LRYSRTGQWFKSYLNNTRQKVEIKFPETNHNTCSEWGIVNHGVLQGSVLGPLLLPIYINDLPATINSQSTPILFADDISIIITHPELGYLQNIMNDVFASLNKWFKANTLALNFDKTNCMRFAAKNNTCPTLNIGFDNKLIEEVEANKFLGLQLTIT
jgi:hypothetical protein